jgi:hypothetical protein
MSGHKARESFDLADPWVHTSMRNRTSFAIVGREGHEVALMVWKGRPCRDCDACDASKPCLRAWRWKISDEHAKRFFGSRCESQKVAIEMAELHARPTPREA